ncbi:unnamed protein product [Allacma fusca]|uniref:Uncharacterized protein n=1 Tax=Allacma fusca TaxID=39272 RepID=A0A8J2NW54_9HEXA|nr:unnamed protein product [Allacma fusca]
MSNYELKVQNIREQVSVLQHQPEPERSSIAQFKIDVPEKRLAHKDRTFVDVPSASTSTLRSAIKTAEVGNRFVEEQPRNIEEELHQAKKLISTLRSKIASELKMTEKLRKAKGEALEESKKNLRKLMKNEKLKIELGLLRRDYLRCQDYIREFEAMVDRNQEDCRF